MNKGDTYLGDVQDVDGTAVRVTLSASSLTGFIYINGQGYRVGQIGSFVRIPIGFNDLYGIVSQVGASALPENQSKTDAGYGWMRIQLIGEGQRNGYFERGLSQYPTIGDGVYLVSEKELRNIYGQPGKPYFVRVGHISNAESIPALVDVNKLVTRHSAVVGTTGSGKSTTVSSLIRGLSDPHKYPSARIVMLDLHGEYGRALRDNANIYRIGGEPNPEKNEFPLHVPFWSLNFDELCDICFGEFANEKDKNIVMERVQRHKVESLAKYPRDGCSADVVNVDSPIPFSIHQLWHELYLETFATYYSKQPGKPQDNLAYEQDKEGNPLKGNAQHGVPPVFRNVKNDANDVEKINYVPGSLNIGKQLLLLGSKLRTARYDFIFNPGKWSPREDGKVELDIDSLLFNWVGTAKPITILDLSGVPTDVLQTTISVVLRVLYDALFWARNLSQGARHRPLLVVMEEAHIYLNDAQKGKASQTVQRIVKEGRKYGIGAMIVSQRPSEIDSTILSQCGTFFAMRLSNSQDRGHITGVLSDNLEGLTSMLPTLRTGEAIILGEAVKLPMRTFIEPPPRAQRPDSQDPIVYDEVAEADSQHPGGWGISMEPAAKYSELAEAWRSQNPKITRLK